MNAAAQAAVSKTIAGMLTRAQQFEDRHNEDVRGGAAITSTPWVIVHLDAGMALDRKGSTLLAKFIEPHLCNMVCLSRERAKEILAGFDKDGWTMVRHAELALLYAQHLRKEAAQLKDWAGLAS